MVRRFTRCDSTTYIDATGGLRRDAKMMMKQCDGFWKKLLRRARNCGLLAYHYSEIGTDDLKQIVQSAVRHNIGTAIAVDLYEGYIPGRKNDRLLRPVRLLPIINLLRTKMGAGEDLRPRAQWQ
jgi:hypothetical protein